MNRTAIVLLCGWILWTVSDRLPTNDTPLAGFETLADCQLAMQQESSRPQQPPGSRLACFPSDFDPRPRMKD